jgi:hypothetical protein
MVAKVAVLWGPVKVSLVAVGVFYLIQALLTYKKSDQDQRPVFDRRNLIKSSGQLLAWVGNGALGVSVKLGRPVFDMLCDASADVGEWVLSSLGGRVLSGALNAVPTRERFERNSR